MKKITLFCLMAIFAISTSLTAQGTNVSESFTGISEVKINIQHGSLTIDKSKTGNALVKGSYNEKEIDLKLKKTGSKLELIEKSQRNNNRNSDESTWTISLPEGIEVNFNIGSGETTVQDFNGTLSGNTGAGGIELNKVVSSDFTYNSGTGNALVRDSEGEFNMNSGTGDISMVNFVGKCKLNSGTGDVSLENVEGKIEANSGTGDLTAHKVSVNKSSSLNSGTGDVSLVLGGDLRAGISVNSGTGNASIDFNGQKFDGTLTMSCSKKHGSIDAPFDFDETKTKGEGKNVTLYKIKHFGDSDVDIKVSTGTGKAVAGK